MPVFSVHDFCMKVFLMQKLDDTFLIRIYCMMVIDPDKI